MFPTICMVLLIVIAISVYLHMDNQNKMEGFRGGRRGGRRRGRRGGFRRRMARGGRRRARRAFRRHWYRPFRYGGWAYPAYSWNWWNWWPVCKRGCSYLGNGAWGCQYPGSGPNDCVWASDCYGCAY